MQARGHVKMALFRLKSTIGDAAALKIPKERIHLALRNSAAAGRKSISRIPPGYKMVYGKLRKVKVG